MCGSDKSLFELGTTASLLGARVLGHGLGTFADGVLGQLAGQEESHRSLNFSTGDCGPLVIVGQARSLRGDPLEDVVDERVHDRHGLAADAGVRMDLLQHLVDVDKVALLSPLLVLLIAGPGGFGLAGCLFGSLTGWLRRHDDDDDDDGNNNVRRVC